MKHFFPTDDKDAATYDEGCEEATDLPLKNVITKENEQLKKETKGEHTRAVQHVAFRNCDHPSSSGSTANPKKNPLVNDFLFLLNCDCFV